MKGIIDNFSEEANRYKQFRPVYPKAIYKTLLKHVSNRDTCLDCGTGNGQVALELSRYFKTVYATDISAPQIAAATPKSNIFYQIERAEKTSFGDQQFDLITVAQAAHWLDIPSFRREVQRISKPSGIVSIWGYGLLRIEKQVDGLIDDFYYSTVGPYWDEERKHIDGHYKAIELGFEPLETPSGLEIAVAWTLKDLEGYLNTWSSVKKYRKDKKENPVKDLVKKLEKIWPEQMVKNISFPLFMKIEKVGIS